MHTCHSPRYPVWGLILSVLLLGAAGLTQGGEPMTDGAFSAASPGGAIPQPWQPLTFPKIDRHTHYRLVNDGGVTVVEAQSEAAASGLTRSVQIDPAKYPLLRWRWKIEHVIEAGDVTSKQGDDYAARIYVTFAYEPDKVSLGRRLKYQAARILYGDVPIGAINYIWDNKSPVGAILDNSYTDSVKMIVVQSGNEQSGLWVTEERNIYQDYKRAFGEEPPMISGIAIMTDTDNTGASTAAFYGDISFAAPE
ncbi:MAG: DUF3047 domain-containing protein [Gammaproteobacteria bacterium]|nr:DUF3047 domain-containing protein [Gammaproteobacteria bacterium]